MLVLTVASSTLERIGIFCVEKSETIHHKYNFFFRFRVAYLLLVKIV